MYIILSRKFVHDIEKWLMVGEMHNLAGCLVTKPYPLPELQMQTLQMDEISTRGW